MSAPTRAVRGLVAERDQGRCVACGAFVVEPESLRPFGQWSIQHRIRRGMGGSRDPQVNAPTNLLTVCGDGTSGCHGRIEHNPIWAKAYGFAVSTWQDPELVPVMHWLYGLAFVTPTGWEAIPKGPDGVLAVASRAASVVESRGLDDEGLVHVSTVLHELTRAWVEDLEGDAA